MAFAALCLGCPIISEPTVYGNAEICHTLSYIKPKIVFCDQEFYPMLNAMKINALFFIFGDHIVDTCPIKVLFEEINDDSDFRWVEYIYLVYIIT